MRQFYLRNGYGQTYSLNDPQTGFLQNPSGLGVTKEYSFASIGDAWMANYVRNAQTMINGEILFASARPYDAYDRLVRFVRSSTDLSIVYTTTAGTYYRDVEFVTLAKSEITEGDVLICEAVFAATSLWYAPVSSTYSVDGSALLALPFSLPDQFCDNTAGDISVENNGSVGAPFRVSIPGPVTNPVITLEVDGTDVYTAAVTYTVPSGSSLRYSSVDNDLYCYSYDGTTETNLFPYMDITNTNFFKLPIGSSTLKVSADTTISGTVVIEVYNLYEAV